MTAYLSVILVKSRIQVLSDIGVASERGDLNDNQPHETHKCEDISHLNIYKSAFS